MILPVASLPAARIASRSSNVAPRRSRSRLPAFSGRSPAGGEPEASPRARGPRERLRERDSDSGRLPSLRPSSSPLRYVKAKAKVGGRCQPGTRDKIGCMQACASTCACALPPCGTHADKTHPNVHQCTPARDIASPPRPAPARRAAAAGTAAVVLVVILSVAGLSVVLASAHAAAAATAATAGGAGAAGAGVVVGVNVCFQVDVRAPAGAAPAAAVGAVSRALRAGGAAAAGAAALGGAAPAVAPAIDRRLVVQRLLTVVHKRCVQLPPFPLGFLLQAAGEANSVSLEEAQAQRFERSGMR